MSTTRIEQQGMVVTPNLIRAIPHIIVVGESGVGKTHFSKTARGGFVLDIENGTGTEFDADHKITYNPGDPELAVRVMRDGLSEVAFLRSYARIYIRPLAKVILSGRKYSVVATHEPCGLVAFAANRTAKAVTTRTFI